MGRKVKSWSSLRKRRKQDLPGNSWSYDEGVKWNEEMVQECYYKILGHGDMRACVLRCI